MSVGLLIKIWVYVCCLAIYSGMGQSPLWHHIPFPPNYTMGFFRACSLRVIEVGYVGGIRGWIIARNDMHHLPEPLPSENVAEAVSALQWNVSLSCSLFLSGIPQGSFC